MKAGRREGRVEEKAGEWEGWKQKQDEERQGKKGNRKENERNKAIVSAVAFISLKGHAQSDLHNAQCIIY